MLARKAVRTVQYPEDLEQRHLRQINSSLNSTELQILTDARSVKYIGKNVTVNHRHINQMKHWFMSLIAETSIAQLMGG